METPSYTPLASTIVGSHGGIVTCMRTTGENIILGLDNGIVVIFDADGKNERRLKTSKSGVWCLDVWKDEKGEEWLVIGGVDLLEIWNTGTLEKKTDLVGHTSTVRCVKTLSATTLITSSRDSTLRVWEIETAQCKVVLEGHSLCVRDFAVYGDLVVSVSYDHDGRVWSLQSQKCLHVLKGHESQLYAVAFDGKRIVTGGSDHSARVWDPESGSCLAVSKVKGQLITQLQLLPSALVGADNSGGFHLWSLEDYSEQQSVEAHDNSVTSIQCTGSNIVTGGSDGKVKVWDLTGNLLQELASSSAVWKVAIMNQHIVAVFSRNNEVVLGIWAAYAST